MAQVNRAHPRSKLIGVQSPGFKIIVGRFNGVSRVGLFEQYVEGEQGARFAIFHPQASARLGPEGRRAVHVVGISARIRCPAEPAGIKFVDTCAAFTAFSWLAVHLAADAASFVLGEFTACCIHAHPQAGETTEKVMNTAGKKPRTLGISPCYASQSHKHRRSSVGVGWRSVRE